MPLKNEKDSTTNFGITSIQDSTASLCYSNKPKQSEVHLIDSLSSSSTSTTSSTATSSSTLPSFRKSHFRIMICGDSGVGKSLLAEALLASNFTCSTPSDPLDPVEMYSTDNNLCIIDTCGYGDLLRAEVVLSHVKSYLVSQFEKTYQLFNASIEDDLLSHMVYQSSDALTHVDVCLYLIMSRMKPVDLEYMRSIHDLVNIVPVIIQPELALRPEAIMKQKMDILNLMHKNGIKFSYLGCDTFQDVLNACKQPFVLDRSSSSLQQGGSTNAATTTPLFHGVLTLKKSLLYHCKHLSYDTTQRFIIWRQQQSHHPLVSSSQKANSIRISQYVSKRRHSMEKEMLAQEKKLRQEFQALSKQRRNEFIASLQSQKVQQQQPQHPMTTLWIALSIILSLFVLWRVILT